MTVRTPTRPSQVTSPVVPAAEPSRRALIGAAWLAVARTPLLVPVGAAALLAVLTVPWQDTHGTSIVHGVAVLLAAGLAAATDDPAGEVADAGATTRLARTGARVGVAAALGVPLFTASTLLAQGRAASTPLVPLTVEAIGWALLVLAVGCGLRAWRDTTAPAYPSVLALVLVAISLNGLPRELTMIDPQTWGPPYAGAMLRWAALGLLSLGVLVAALRDAGEPASDR